MKDDEKGISYVCRYRLMDMFQKYLRNKRLIELDKKIAKVYLKIYQGDYSSDDDWSEWDKKFGKYRYYDWREARAAIMIEMLAFLYCIDPLIEERETRLYQEHIQVVSKVDQSSENNCFIITVEPLKSSKK